VEGDTVAVGSDPAAVTGETCTRDQHPTSWEDAVDRWAKGQGAALKPCKASQCRGKCCFRSPDVKAPWCYTRAGARCKVVTVDSPPRSSPRGVDGVEGDEADEDDGDDVTSSEEDVEDGDGHSSSAEDEEVTEDDEDDEDAEDGGWKMEEMGCKICCTEGSWCKEIRQRFAASLSAQRRKIMSEFRRYHRRIPRGGSQGVIIMSSAVRKKFTYAEFYGDSMDSEGAKDALRALGMLCKTGSESVVAQRRLGEFVAKVKDAIAQCPKDDDVSGLNALQAQSFLVVLKVKLLALLESMDAVSDGNARDKQVAPGTPGEHAISESGGGYGDDGGVRSDGSGGRVAGATTRSRSSSPEEREDGGDSSREQREAAPAASPQAAHDPGWTSGIASAFAFYASNERDPAAVREIRHARTEEQTRVRLEAAKKRAESARKKARTAEANEQALGILAQARQLETELEAGAEETAGAAGDTAPAAGDTAAAAGDTAAAAGDTAAAARDTAAAARDTAAAAGDTAAAARDTAAAAAARLAGKRPRSPSRYALRSNRPDRGKKGKTDGCDHRIRGFKEATPGANVVVTSGRVQGEKLAKHGFFLAEFGATQELLDAAKSRVRKYAPIFEVYPHRVSTGGDYPELHCQVEDDAKELWPRQQSVILPRKGKISDRARKIVETLRDAVTKHAPLLTEDLDGEGKYGLREATFIKDQDITERFLQSLSGYHQQEGFEFPAYVGPSLQTPHRDAADAARTPRAFSCVVALEENTFLRVWPGTHNRGKKPFCTDKHQDIHIPRGKMLVFDSSLYHAGLGNGNRRLHFQFDDMESDAQSTHFSNAVSKVYWSWVKESY